MCKEDRGTESGDVSSTAGDFKTGVIGAPAVEVHYEKFPPFRRGIISLFLKHSARCNILSVKFQITTFALKEKDLGTTGLKCWLCLYSVANTVGLSAIQQIRSSKTIKFHHFLA